MELGREANHKASEWLPAELFEAEAAKPAARRFEWKQVPEPGESGAPDNGSPEARARPARGDRRAALKPFDNGKRRNGSRPPAEPAGSSFSDPAPSPSRPRLDLNQVRFDQLRRLGLAPHQAAGVIGRREQCGGFSSLDELDELNGKYGLAQTSIEELKASLVV